MTIEDILIRILRSADQILEDLESIESADADYSDLLEMRGEIETFHQTASAYL